MTFNWDDYHFPNEMMEQADAIENCMKVLKDRIRDIAEKAKDMERVYIVGSGDCYFIGFAAAQAFREYCHIEATGYEAYDFSLMQPVIDDKTMVILFSSSGKSVYVINSLEFVNKKNAFVVGVTNHEDSPLGQGCTMPLVTVATGVSKSFPTKTSTSGLALMYALAAELGIVKGTEEEKCRELLAELETALPDAIRRIYSEEKQKIDANAYKFLEARTYAFAGSGPARTASMIGAAKMIETCSAHPCASNSEEFLHLIGYSIKSPDVVVVIGNNISDHREKQVIEACREQFARAFVIGNVDIEESDSVVHVAPFIKDLTPYSAVIASMVVTHIFAAAISKLEWHDPDSPHDVDMQKSVKRLYTGPVSGWNSTR